MTQAVSAVQFKTLPRHLDKVTKFDGQRAEPLSYLSFAVFLHFTTAHGSFVASFPGPHACFT